MLKGGRDERPATAGGEIFYHTNPYYSGGRKVRVPPQRSMARKTSRLYLSHPLSTYKSWKK